MDKSWMTKQRLTEEYQNGLHQFLDMAFNSACFGGKIMCPCKCCRNGKWVKREIAKEHLTVDGFMKGYTHWIAHGEDSSYSKVSSQHNENFDNFDNMDNLVRDAFRFEDNNMEDEEDENDLEDEPNEQAKSFYKLLNEAQQELYPGCKKFSKLEFIVFGGDKDGQVRLYGLGVKATDIYGGKVSRATLLRQNMEYREELAKLQADVEMLKRGACGTSHMVEQSDSESDQVASPPISHPQRIRVGSFVVLKSLINSSEVVAIGIVSEMGGVRVNGMVLGPAFCNIVVQSIVKKDQHLAFPHGRIQTIGDSLGAPVAWPLSSIALDGGEN